jgi:hypothetical membrane protein
LLASGLVFFLFNTLAEGIYPGYSVATDALSDLGSIGAPTSLLWDGQVFVTGVLILLGMYFLFYKSEWGRGIGNKRRLVGVVYLLPGIGIILVSLFPDNFVFVIHAIAALVVFVLGGVGAIYAYRLTRPPFRYFSVALGVISLASVPLWFASDPATSGLIERLVVYPYVLWLACFGCYFLAFQVT